MILGDLISSKTKV